MNNEAWDGLDVLGVGLLLMVMFFGLLQLSQREMRAEIRAEQVAPVCTRAHVGQEDE